MFATGPRAVSADDQDWFAVEVEAGTNDRFDLEGRDTGSSSLRDPVLRRIFDSSGTRIDDTWDDDGGGEGYNAPVIRKKEDRPEAADHVRSKTRNQHWIDFLRSTRDESTNQRRNHAGMVRADRRLIKFGARG